MKKIFAGLLFALSLSAVAETEAVEAVYPYVYNNGYSVQVQIWNNDNRSIRCSGYINMTTDQGRDSKYFSEFVSPRMTSYRTVYPSRINSRILSVNHSIFCF